MFDVFSQLCLGFGLLMALIAAVANRRERRRLEHAAILRRLQW